MKASIETPAHVLEVLEDRASQSRISLESMIIQVLEQALLAEKDYAPDKEGQRVQLPLIPSSHPGTLRSLTGAQIDDLLG